MIDENDDKPRRNLMAISLVFIVYAIAEGNLSCSGSFGIAHTYFHRPELIEYVAIALFMYFYWSYWVSHPGTVIEFFNKISNDVRSNKHSLVMLRYSLLRLVEADSIEGSGLKTVLYSWRYPNTQLTKIVRTGFWEWKVSYNGNINAKDNNGQFITLHISGQLNPDAYIVAWLRSLTRLTFTTKNFRDLLLPYSFAILAAIISLTYQGNQVSQETADCEIVRK